MNRREKVVVLAFVMVLACSHRGPDPFAEPKPSNQPAWVTNPCASDSFDDFGWTKYALRDHSIRVPRDYRRMSARSLDYLRFQKSGNTLSLGLDKNGWYRLQGAIHARGYGLKVCDGEFRGEVVQVAAYRVGNGYGITYYWPRVRESERGLAWLWATISARDAEEATKLRQAVFTLQWP